jgi:hypothetical protein
MRRIIELFGSSVHCRRDLITSGRRHSTRLLARRVVEPDAPAEDVAVPFTIETRESTIGAG